MTRASRRKHHTIYKTTCLVTGRYYVGMHSTDDLNDTYLGSGLRLLRSVKKYGADQHRREILEDLPTREAASNRERELITKEMRADPQCLNCGAGGLGAVDRPPTTEETRAKKSVSMKLAWANGMAGSRGQKQKPETIAKRAAAHKGKKRSDEQKANLATGLLGHYADSENLAKHAARMGKEEVSAKKRASMLARLASETSEQREARFAKMKAAAQKRSQKAGRKTEVMA